MKFRKKPIIIEAVLWEGTDESYDKIVSFMKNVHVLTLTNNILIIPTLEGNMEVYVGDYIIKGICGDFYPCKPDIFNRIYDLVEE